MKYLIKRLRRTVRVVVLGSAAVGWALSSPAQAAVDAIPSTPTSIAGSAERMISYRHQYHMWQTADGSIHALVNVGVAPTGSGLQMFTSMDNGVTWVAGVQLPNADDTSTSDGFLAGNNLYVTYSTTNSAVAFSLLQHDAASQSWNLVSTEMPFQSNDVLAINPTIARDGAGRYWLAFTSQDRSSNYNIKLLRRSSAAEGWVDTGLLFGPTDNLSIERSARPVAVLGGVGMIYTVHQNVYWARRSNSTPDDAPWANSLIYTNQFPDTDPFGSHFSVAVDAQSNVHMAMVDGGQLLYFRMLNSTQKWAMKVMTKPVQATYMQILGSGGSLMMIYNNKTKLGVLQSGDTGKTWRTTQALTHPASDGATDYSHPRMEVPGNNPASPVPVLQQYLDGTVQRAMSFRVPVVSSFATTLTTGP